MFFRILHFRIHPWKQTFSRTLGPFHTHAAKLNSCHLHYCGRRTTHLAEQVGETFLLKTKMQYEADTNFPIYGECSYITWYNQINVPNQLITYFRRSKRRWWWWYSCGQRQCHRSWTRSYCERRGSGRRQR